MNLKEAKEIAAQLELAQASEAGKALAERGFEPIAYPEAGEWSFERKVGRHTLKVEDAIGTPTGPNYIVDPVNVTVLDASGATKLEKFYSSLGTYLDGTKQLASNVVYLP